MQYVYFTYLYNEFIKKYYNGKLPKEIDELKLDYNKTLFRFIFEK